MRPGSLVWALVALGLCQPVLGQGPPGVDVDVLVKEVSRLSDDVRAEAERLIANEGADLAITRLEAEAEADEAIAFERLNLASIVAALGKDEQACIATLRLLPDLPEDKMPDALARHVVLMQCDYSVARPTSLLRLLSRDLSRPVPDERMRRVRAALSVLERLAPDARTIARDLDTAGMALFHWERLDEALVLIQEADRLLAEHAPESLDRATVLSDMGLVRSASEDFKEAMDCLARALAIVEPQTPESVLAGKIHNRMAGVFTALGDLAAAAEHCDRALDITEAAAPRSIPMVIALTLSGNTEYLRDELEVAAGFYQRALDLVMEIEPTSLEAVRAFGNLGNVRAVRGDLDGALDCYCRQLAMAEARDPGSLAAAIARKHIAEVQQGRGDLDAALDGFSACLRTQEGVDPNSLDVSHTLNSLGVLCADEQDWDGALAYFQRSLAILESAAPASPYVSTALNNIGVVHEAEDDTAAALDFFRRALEAAETSGPGSLPAALARSNIGRSLAQLGQGEAALSELRQALAIHERVAPDSVICAYTHNELGDVQESLGEMSPALEEYRAAVGVLETARQTAAVDAEVQSRFAAGHLGLYHDLIAALLRVGDVDQAADTAERMRARALLERLAERGVDAGLPPDLASKQENLNARRNRLYGELRNTAGTDPAEPSADEVHKQLTRLQLEQESLTREIRSANPRYADLVYPNPMTAAEIAGELEPGALVLDYVVTEDIAFLFVYGPGLDTEPHEISVSAKDLGARVNAYLAAISPRQAKRGDDGTRPIPKTPEEWQADAAEADRIAAELGELLLEPVAERLRQARTLLLLPDGPLWALPFQALTVAGGVVGDLIPVHYAPSATVLVRERAGRSGAGGGRGVLALGDPEFGVRGDPGDDRAVYMPIRGGAFEATERSGDRLRFAPIPWSGVEASLTDGMFRPESDLRQGLLATEKAVRENGPGRRVIHLATHGLIDPLSPMDSAVALSPGPDEEAFDNDGFLKAWEVFGLKLDGCDLVTLSACETARGEVLSGEGVIGLTRAFLYAGAASVLCTQWSVSDDSTAALMVRFYTHYREGDAKDVALRKAMREIRTGKLEDGSPLELPDPLAWREEWSHPYYWAPFILMGEWQQTG